MRLKCLRHKGKSEKEPKILYFKVSLSVLLITPPMIKKQKQFKYHVGALCSTLHLTQPEEWNYPGQFLPHDQYNSGTWMHHHTDHIYDQGARCFTYNKRQSLPQRVHNQALFLPFYRWDTEAQKDQEADPQLVWIVIALLSWVESDNFHRLRIWP